MDFENDDDNENDEVEEEAVARLSYTTPTKDRDTPLQRCCTPCSLGEGVTEAANGVRRTNQQLCDQLIP